MSTKTHNSPKRPFILNLEQTFAFDKLSLIALCKIIKDSSEALGITIDLNQPLTAVCEEQQLSRSSVYSRVQQFRTAFKELRLPGRGRPAAESLDNSQPDHNLREQVLRYRLAHPGAVVNHASGRVSYSDGFIRFTLDAFDEWLGAVEAFCHEVEVPYQSFHAWRLRDEREPYIGFEPREIPEQPYCLSETCRTILDNYTHWEGSLRDFLREEARRSNLNPTQIARLLKICKMVPQRSRKKDIRYRGSTEALQPGSMLVTDGQELQVILTGSGEVCTYNWQGTVDQATGCTTATVITETECAHGVLDAFNRSCEFIGRPPQALLHDNKSIYEERELREQIEQATVMIPATPGRGQNKAIIEGTFGKVTQQIGSTIYLDDSSRDTLIQSALLERQKAYAAGADHAERARFDGKSRIEVLREYCSDPEKDKKFLENLRADHTRPRSTEYLPTHVITRKLLDDGFEQFGLEQHDLDGKIRTWLANRYTPEAVGQGLAIFAAEREKGRLKNKMAHRYLVKVIQNCQDEIDLRIQEEILLKYGSRQQLCWLEGLEEEKKIILEDQPENELSKESIFNLSEKALFGGLPIQRAFWEKVLCQILKLQPTYFKAVRKHVRRMFESEWQDRFSLISKLVNWELGLA